MRLQDEAENTTNEGLQDSLYGHSREIITIAKKEFLPKLQVISNALNAIYDSRKSTFRSLLILHFITFELISISAYEDLYEYF